MAKESKSFISHSINYEDVLLQRLFPTETKGFFVDVGAADPVNDNDTYGLSQLGWTGINVEPNPAFFARLETERPNDHNLKLAVSDREGMLDWYQVGDTGLSTCDTAEAARAASKGYEVTRVSVPTTTLAKIFGEVGPEIIDLLKVDVEGLELKVLTGNDWDRWRPKVIVVEATLPESKERRTDKVGPFLKERGYRCAHFDGLNDWFVEGSFTVPANAFLPPNIFDGFVTRRQAEAEDHGRALAEQARSATIFAESLQQQIDKSSAAVEDLTEQINKSSAVIEDLTKQIDSATNYVRQAKAAQADLKEDVRRSRLASQETQERYAALANDHELRLQAIAVARSAAVEAEELMRMMEARAAQAELRCRAIETSSSWLVTRPIRVIIRRMRAR